MNYYATYKERDSAHKAPKIKTSVLPGNLIGGFIQAIEERPATLELLSIVPVKEE